MRKFLLLWLLVFALIVQSIGQASLGCGMHHGTASSEVKAFDSIAAEGNSHADHAATSNTQMPSCHENGQPPSVALNSQTEESESPTCPCCDDDCSMPRCSALFLGLAARLELTIIDVGTEAHSDISALLINRSAKPPTPPPNLAQI